MTSDLNFPQCERNGVDQGMHNVLIYLNLIPIKICDYYSFPVINLQSATTDHKFHHENKSIMLARASSHIPYAIVHQYDRFDVFQKDLVDSYIPWMNTSNPLQELTTNHACSPYKILQGLDMTRGLCDLNAQNVLSVGACCDLCFKLNNPDQYVLPTIWNNTIEAQSNITSYSNKVCTGFIFDGQKCFLKKCSEEENFKAYTDMRLQIQFMHESDRELLMTRNIRSYFLAFSNPQYLQIIQR
ncbi:hypothetical protein EON65_31690 [archaeon]|nr:MAG: hypothetical protein EON65_31690 [archaeon]